MDVTMGKKTVVCYNKVFEYSEVCEGAVESVVPDTMPDIDRILCADGTLVIRSKEVSDGSVSVTAGVAATVLYVPEGEKGVRNLSAAIPLSIIAEAPGITQECIPVAMLKLCSVEARMLNPRKVLVRVSVEVSIECHDRADVEYCCEITGPGADEIHSLVESRAVNHVVCVREKTFVVKDEFHIPAGRPKIGEILRYSVELFTEDMKAVGSKLVINGTAKVGILYTANEKNDVNSAEFETSFSQIIETDRELTAPDCRASMLLTAVFIDPITYPGGERGVSCELHVVAQAICSDNVKVNYISDCYSNRHQMRVSSESAQAVCDIRRSLVRCNVHEQIEAAQPVGEVREVCCQLTDLKAENGILKCKMTAAVIYSDDTGTVYCATRRFPVECPAENEDNMICRVISARCVQIYATPAHKSIDIRAQVCFEVMLCRMDTISQITDISFAEGAPADADRPSLVVVRAGENATLWLLAKHYRSTCELISSVNELGGGDQIAGKVLLIPTAK